ncbi:hypothetical protein MNV49_006531 [Pseudohyphozyma bogoriensis]|nr:hypothetical protein MNV49_006531 [Pseudohyphozyma bogoriensis]
MSDLRTPSKAVAFGIGMFAAFGGFLFGYDTGYISGVKGMQYFIDTYGDLQPDGKYAISTSTDSLITSILSVGTFFGALASAPVGSYLGRKKGIWSYLLTFAVGVALQTAATGSKSRAMAMFSVGRVFAGLGVGGVSCLVPIFQSEVSPKEWRGFIVSAYQLFITIGLLIAAVIVNATQYRYNASCFQIPIGVQFVWFFILVVGLFFLPESPRWLILKGRDQEALQSLSTLYRLPIESPYVTDEFANIASSIHHEKTFGKTSYMDLLFRSKESRLPFRVWTGILLQSLQQLSGINFIMYYGTTFFQRSGISNSFMITIAINVVNTGMTIPGMWAVDKLGRRRTMIFGAAGMFVAQIIVAATGTAIGVNNESGQKVLVAFSCIYIGIFAAIWGPYAWVITGEIVPNSVRSQAVSLTTGAQWLWNFGIGYATPYMVDSGPGKAGLGAKVFFIWGGCCLIAVAFAYLMIPETKGLSLEQVDLLYRNSSIMGSTAYNRKILAENLQDETKEGYSAALRDKVGGTEARFEGENSITKGEEERV